MEAEVFGRMVKIDDKEYFVMCIPKTPFSEVLRRASEMVADEERKAYEASPDYVAYRQAVDSI